MLGREWSPAPSENGKSRATVEGAEGRKAPSPAAMSGPAAPTPLCPSSFPNPDPHPAPRLRTCSPRPLSLGSSSLGVWEGARKAPGARRSSNARVPAGGVRVPHLAALRTRRRRTLPGRTRASESHRGEGTGREGAGRAAAAAAGGPPGLPNRNTLSPAAPRVHASGHTLTCAHRTR